MKSKGPAVVILLMLAIFALSQKALADGVDSTFNPQVQTSTYFNKQVTHLIPLPDGKAIAAGNFNNYNGLPVGGLIRLNADATLDTTFNNHILVSGYHLESILVQQDGKLILAGSATFSDGTEMLTNIVRLLANGDRDHSFDAPLTFPYQQTSTNHFALDSAGRVVAAGYFSVLENGTYVEKSFIRLSENGSVDAAYSGPTNRRISGMGIQGNKLLFVENDVINSGWKLYRLNEDGTADTSFPDPNIGHYGIIDIAVQPDGKIYVLTTHTLSRRNADGTADTQFQSPPNFPGTPRKINLRSDGRIVIAHGSMAPYGMAVVQFLANGNSDPGFTPHIYLDGWFDGHTLLPDGSMLIGDNGQNSSSNRFTKLLPNGVVDPTFNTGGTGFQNINPCSIRTLNILPSGKILIAGAFDLVNGTQRSKIAMLNDNSTLDPTFQINTTATGNYFSTIKYFNHIVRQPDAKLIVSGDFIYQLNGVQKRNIVRLNADGSIDPTFVLGPVINESSEISNVGSNPLFVRTDGKMLIGTSRPGSNSVQKIPMLLNSDGTEDVSFEMTVLAPAAIVAILDVALQPDGKMLIAGRRKLDSAPQNELAKSFIFRINANGSADTTFQFTEQIGVEISSVEMLPDGKLLIVSRVTGASTVSRLNADGSVDTAFNIGTGSVGKINTMSALPSGKIIVGGKFTAYNSIARRNLVLLNADGSIAENPGNINDEVLTTASDAQGRILIGGSFTSINNGSQNVILPYVARLNAPTAQNVRSPFDFDGDGKTDLSIFRPTAGEWWYQRSSNGTNGAARFGAATDKIAPVDLTGDGKTDIAIWRPATGEWFVLRSEDSSFYAFPFGTDGDVPVPADYDGDSRADAAVLRPSTMTWYISRSTGGSEALAFGSPGDQPVNADYDGDGRTDIAVYRPNAPNGAEWWVRRSSNSSVFALQFGTATDRTVPGDYTGDGVADIAVWRPATGEWYVLRSENNSFFAFPFGVSTDVPVPGDYDGDGKIDAGVFRPSNSNWYINRSNSGILIQQFGTTGDMAVPNAFVR